MTPVDLSDCEGHDETLRWVVWWLRGQPKKGWYSNDIAPEWREEELSVAEAADELEVLMTRTGIEVV